MESSKVITPSREDKYHPQRRMSITLKTKEQNNLLFILNELNMTNESFTHEVQFIMSYMKFGTLMFKIAKMDNPPKLSDLNIEEVDNKQVKKIIYVPY